MGAMSPGHTGPEAACLLSGTKNGKADADVGEVLRQKATLLGHSAFEVGTALPAPKRP
jgi:hypothetical protein